MGRPNVTVFHDEQLVLTLQPLMHWGGDGEPAGVTAAKLFLGEAEWLHRLVVEPMSIVATFWVDAESTIEEEGRRLAAMVAHCAAGDVVIERRLA
jgi:hypothetical protein